MAWESTDSALSGRKKILWTYLSQVHMFKASVTALQAKCLYAGYNKFHRVSKVGFSAFKKKRKKKKSLAI